MRVVRHLGADRVANMGGGLQNTVFFLKGERRCLACYDVERESFHTFTNEKVVEMDDFELDLFDKRDL